MTTRAAILDLARASIGKRMGAFERLALLDAAAIAMVAGGGYLYRLPGSGSSVDGQAVIRAWVAAARRADAKTRGPGQPAKGRPHRRTVRTTDATEAGLVRIAEAAGRGVPDVASELLESAVKAKGGCDE